MQSPLFVCAKMAEPVNMLGLAKVMVKNKMSRFLWFTVYIARRV